jgi:hypothetical protein
LGLCGTITGDCFNRHIFFTVSALGIAASSKVLWEMGEFWRSDEGHVWFSEFGGQSYHTLTKDFQMWLGVFWYERYGQIIGNREIRGLVRELETWELPTYPVYRRVGVQGGQLYLDLGQDVVVIGDGDWWVIPRGDCPVRFAKAEERLPTPQSGGDLSELQRILALSDQNFSRLLPWVLSCFQPGGGKQILVLRGPAGSGKSTMAWLLHRLIDPSPIFLLNEVPSVKLLNCLTNQHWLLSYDHIYSLSRPQRERVLGLATGRSPRPQILTTLHWEPKDPLFSRHALFLDLERLDPSVRRAEMDIEGQLRERASYLLGAILDLLCKKTTGWEPLPC